MALKTVARFEVDRLELLDAEGRVDPGVAVDVTDETLLDVYKKMVELRIFDEKAAAMQRQNKLGAYPQLLGQEATQIVPPLVLTPKDWMVPTYRGHGAYHARGLKFRYILLYWAGDERGLRLPEGSNDMIFSFPVGTHLTQAAGLGWAAKLRKEDAVVLAYLGDGATAKGDFHESMTLAGRLGLPVVYLVENNRYGGAGPARERGPETIAQKAFAYGAAAIQVDGNDPLAVHQAVSEAVARARRGEGPTVAECDIYRPGTQAKGESPTADYEDWKRKDPVARLRKHLASKGLWDDNKEIRLKIESEALVRYETEEFEGALPPNPLNMFSYNYACAPWHLREQRKELEAILEIKRSRNEIDALPPVEGSFP
ncbi:MAG: pyruvate dehydrogenase (acetyl-transferring) E1 component subunit alpha [Elusimicrobia bacterium]|nr:pyruvate dehydrogenase (acetyl-transferring) E1 component subunit alpha [Elusimicrobiota bacterium]